MGSRKNEAKEWKIVPDKGCEAYPKCGECPLPRCLEDYPTQRKKQILKDLRFTKKMRGLTLARG